MNTTSLAIQLGAERLANLLRRKPIYTEATLEIDARAIAGGPVAEPLQTARMCVAACNIAGISAKHEAPFVKAAQQGADAYFALLAQRQADESPKPAPAPEHEPAEQPPTQPDLPPAE